MCECCMNYFERRRIQRMTLDEFEHYDVKQMDSNELKYFIKTFRSSHRDELMYTLSRWDTSGIDDMSYLFYQLGLEYVELTGWDVKNVVSMRSM